MRFLEKVLVVRLISNVTVSVGTSKEAFEGVGEAPAKEPNRVP